MSQLQLTIPDGYQDGREYNSEDLGVGQYTHRFGVVTLAQLGNAVAWIGEVVPGITSATLSAAPCIGMPAGQAPFGPVQVAFEVAGRPGLVRADACAAVAMAPTLRIELLNEFFEGDGNRVYVPAPKF